MDFLKSIILVSEKAANIARAIRQESHLLSLLIQEKKEGEKNPRFDRDFKTLADVLVQEVVKYDLGKKFPGLTGHIYGEESNEFEVQSGEKVYLKVDVSKENTVKLLSKILDDKVAVEILANLVHQQVTLSELPETVSFPENLPDIPVENIAIWIDPIDSTGEYISGKAKKQGDTYTGGLPCVTVLIGAYLRDSGTPVAGVVNQPFRHLIDNKTWKGHIVWGLNFQGTAVSSATTPKTSKVVVISSSESADIKKRLTESGYELLETSGAGYKLLCVIEGTAGAYVLSKGSTFYWDTCSSDAILRSLGGGIVHFKKAIGGAETADIQLTYSDHSNLSNQDGLIAYTNQSTCDSIVRTLQ